MRRQILKRKIDNILSHGYGSQLGWLLVISTLCLIAGIFVAEFVFQDKELSWQYVLVLFLDPGTLANMDGHHDVFRITIALVGLFLFSTLLISVFTNIFDNITSAVRDGRRRYKLQGHVLILGSAHRLQGILDAMEHDERTVVVMSPEPVHANGRFIYYKGSRMSVEDLRSARPDKASCIYIIGEDNESGHDANSLRTLTLLRGICQNAKKPVHCYVTVHEHSTTQVFLYMKQKADDDRKLLVDIVNDREYEAEQLLVDTDFLPVLKSGNKHRAHIFVLGTGVMAEYIATTAAHVCHYPNYTEAGIRTCITVIGSNANEWADRFKAAYDGLFQLSDCGFLDIEWQFVNISETSAEARNIMTNAIKAGDAVRAVVCKDTSNEAIDIATTLPRPVYEEGEIAVYLKDSVEIIQRANLTGMYDVLRIFGPANTIISDPLFQRRFTRGQRVNYVYDKAYGNPPSPNMETAWYKLPEAHKYSSIYCANAMPLRRMCFDMNGDRMPIYEAEHRRWMMSVLLMGFRAGKETDRKHFIHADIVPFDDLTDGEKDKDKILIDAMLEILKPV